MTVQDLIDELEALPKSAKSAQVVMWEHDGNEAESVVVESVTYSWGEVHLNLDEDER